MPELHVWIEGAATLIEALAVALMVGFMEVEGHWPWQKTCGTEVVRPANEEGK